MNSKLSQLFIFFLFFNVSIRSQETSNLQVFNNLTDSVSYKILEVLPNNISSLELKPYNENDLSILYEFIRAKLIKSGIRMSSETKYDEKLSINFNEAKIEYKDLFKNHLFGDYFMTRQVKLSGNFILERQNKILDFDFCVIDTVEFDIYTNLENKIYSITEGIPPKEPFFSSLMEPLIAISATATAIILFFTIRSK